MAGRNLHFVHHDFAYGLWLLLFGPGIEALALDIRFRIRGIGPVHSVASGLHFAVDC